MSRVGWTSGYCAVGHKHRSSAKRNYSVAVAACNAKVDRLMKAKGWSFESICDRCVQHALDGKPVKEPRICSGCGDLTCSHFFPSSSSDVCYACDPAHNK